MQLFYQNVLLIVDLDGFVCKPVCFGPMNDDAFYVGYFDKNGDFRKAYTDGVAIPE